MSNDVAVENNMSKEQFFKSWSLALEILDKKFSSDVAEFYYETFKHISFDKFNLAIKEILRYKKYPSIPLPNEIFLALGIDNNSFDDCI
jgi:hypothetical protein